MKITPEVLYEAIHRAHIDVLGRSGYSGVLKNENETTQEGARIATKYLNDYCTYGHLPSTEKK